MASEQLTATIDMLRELALFTGDLEADRAAMGGTGPGVPDDFPHEELTVADRPAIWGRANEAAEDAAILYLHGGGYVMGSVNTHRQLVARIARASGARALAIDYRLAPEHPHPAALARATCAAPTASMPPMATTGRGDASVTTSASVSRPRAS